jgi:dTDP-4-dehydrorhamnose reductase
MLMEASTPTVLVVGADGMIGCSLMARLQQEGVRVLGTTRRLAYAENSLVFLRLEDDLESWRCPSQVQVAVLCAGVSKIEACERDPEGTARANVRGTSILAQGLASAGKFVIYLSTNQVFDGTVPQRQPFDPLSPRTEYGRQKAEVERRLQALGDKASVVRLTKVLQPGMPLLKGWKEELQSKRAIRPFADMTMAPVPLSFVVDVLRRLILWRLPGVIQVSGSHDVSYAEVAFYLAQRVGADQALVQPTTAREAGFNCHVPKFTSLDRSRLRDRLGFEAAGVWLTIDQALNESARKRLVTGGFAAA